MQRPPDPDTLCDALYRVGLARSAARRIAGEWFDHRDALIDDALAAGLDRRQARREASHRLGPPRLLVEQFAGLPDVCSRRLRRGRMALLVRWGGAGVGSLTSTCAILAAATSLVGI